MIPRLTAANSAVVVIDVQAKLVAAVPLAADLLLNIGFALDVANLLNVPVMATEQYPKGLGPTHPDLLRRLPQPVPAKTAFSCGGCPGFLADLRRLNRPAVVLVGIEAHVCVMQTAFDLIDAGYTVFIPVDAVASRYEIDRETALRRLERAGAIPTTVEAVAFEWVADSTNPQFKAVSKLVIDRVPPF